MSYDPTEPRTIIRGTCDPENMEFALRCAVTFRGFQEPHKNVGIRNGVLFQPSWGQLKGKVHAIAYVTRAGTVCVYVEAAR